MPGSIPGELSASSSGAATYTIPIESPLGVGVQPTLSLAYSSQSGKGIAGWGWNIAGLSSVTRTHSIPYFDEKNKSLSWDSSCPLALDGQRLLQEARWGTDSIHYRLEGDPGTLVRAYSIQSWGPSYLKVFTKEGLVMKYGDPAKQTSYTMCYDNASLQANPVKYGWNLVEVVDANENYMEVEHMHSLDNAYGNVVRKISYGRNKRNGTTGTLITMLFEYEKRNDQLQGYVAGKELLQQLRLKSIQSSVGGAVQREYRLSYQTGVAISRLASIALYNSQGKQIVYPLEFSYGEAATSQTETNISFITKHADGKNKEQLGIVAIDFDGDGVCELGDIYSKKESNEFGETAYAYLDVRKKSQNWNSVESFPVAYATWYSRTKPYSLFGDFNGNGAADRLMVYTEGANPKGKHLSFRLRDCSDHSQLFDEYLGVSSEDPFISVGNCAGSAFSTLLAIFNEPQKVTNGYGYFYEQVMGGIDKVTNYPDGCYFVVPNKIKDAKLVKFSQSDYRDDLWVTLANNTNLIVVNNQNNTTAFFTNNQINPGLNIGVNDLCRFADMNGDGLVDIVYRKNLGDWKIAYNKGDYTFDVQILDIPLGNKTDLRQVGHEVFSYADGETENDELFLIDVDQDGLVDIISANEIMRKDDGVYSPGLVSYTYFFDTTAWNVYLNTGNNFQKWGNEEVSPKKADYSCFGDLTGNGTINWVYGKANGNLVVTDFGFSRNANLLTGIKNPMSGVTALNYAPQTDRTVKTVDTHPDSNFMMYGGDFLTSRIGNYAFSGLMGGLSAELSGGDFWQGGAIGVMSTSLNHLQQKMAKPSFEDLLKNFPMDKEGGALSSPEVYKLIGGMFMRHI